MDAEENQQATALQRLAEALAIWERALQREQEVRVQRPAQVEARPAHETPAVDVSQRRVRETSVSVCDV